MEGLLRFSLRILANAAARRPPGDGIPCEPERYGLSASSPSSRARLRGVFQSFFAGVETGFRRPRSSSEPPASLSALYHPFFWEGTAMGRAFARWLTFRSGPLFDTGVSLRDPFPFLQVVGVGFARSQLRPRDLGSPSRIGERFGNLGALVADGFGFGIGLFRWRGTLGATAELLAGADGDDRRSFLNGLGRSLWFHCLDRPEEAVEAARATGEARWLLAGLGLASAFTFTDELGRAYGIASRLAGDERRAFVEGIRVALFVRDHSQGAELAGFLSRSEGAVRVEAEADLAVARAAHAETSAEPSYVRLFRDRCFAGGGEPAGRSGA